MSIFLHLVWVGILVALCTATHVHAITLQLRSADFKHGAKETLQTMIANNNDAQHCVLVELDDSSVSKGFIRYTYKSNASSTMRRLPLVVSTHRPMANDDGTSLPDLNNAEHIYATHEFTTDQLNKYTDMQAELRRKAEHARRDRNGENHNTENDDGAGEGDMSLVVHPVLMSDRHDAKAIPGYYAVCFSLGKDSVRTSPKLTKKSVSEVELVEITILEVSTTLAQQTNGKKRVLSKGLSRERRGDNQRGGHNDEENEIGGELDSDYAAMIRKIYNAKPNVNVADIVNNQIKTVSSEMTVKMLTKVINVEESMLRVIKFARNFDHRHDVMRSITESTYTRIWISTIAIVVAMSAMVWFTFFYTRSIILKRKLI